MQVYYSMNRFLATALLVSAPFAILYILIKIFRKLYESRGKIYQSLPIANNPIFKVFMLIFFMIQLTAFVWYIVLPLSVVYIWFVAGAFDLLINGG